jgi:hypothetical protein
MRCVTRRAKPGTLQSVSLGEKISLSLALALFCCVCAPFSTGQVSASLSGRVTDSSGAAVSGASVDLNSLDTGVSRSADTDAGGRYRFVALPVGLYEVRVTKPGFAEGVRSGIRLAVGQDANADISLRIGKVSEQV